ncbi:glutamine synthetase III [Mucilaginibacter sp. P25]|uniref:Glutamine synthetase III n=2 Tax=Mucilaginibacter TaxID=423349 RepID=A0AAE6MGK9_9SPHI|nr:MULTISPECIES: glutamine synthetase III [Mucilaginibacter]QEM02660.1 glutamine synthetase type III [Mucilaginibacter rubeus]QEM15280.1 glutamine synthetase type III [Mucilaginibacter gossypii]QTE39678.1 glutamine synthetase III [Mucilaginibacter gossypii]QTE41991.1 glutamine synthetase III [Mucilaginibacter rubeus]QTE48592.1 glutamine synthetase III [Mucilaginibacter rubeus]
MSNIRFKALQDVLSRTIPEVKPPSPKISDYFGSNVFDKKKMKEYLSSEAYQGIVNSIEKGEPIPRDLAEQIASAMKAWALGKGATHYTHWFQPLTGTTAEKHDAFFEPTADGGAIERFSGDALAQQEPDASSFPSGGIRNTFEARGYTAWDPSSPAFLMARTLCIPTVFVSYTGEALDYKVPLLKALNVLDKAAVDVCHYFDKGIEKVNASLGIEQEYFLVDLALFNARPDLYLTGRTLFGHMSAKNQQLEDHYFGSIPERVYAYMQDMEAEALQLGIPLKTRHNEVAPSQFECAPIYEEINLAIDHNQLLMDLMDRVARRHNFKVLLHEKPYAGLNGSGKHNNWSLITNTGKNLLSPGKTPKNNLMFLAFFVNTIKAVHEHADLLRASIASVNNDHRLGANEAPPAIISIFLGSQLSDVLDEIETSRISKKIKEENLLWQGIPKIPQILPDNTDRNRTSPFAFTGNKFELRAVGSSANSASPMTILNLIVADQLKKFKYDVDKLMKKGEKKDLALLMVIKKYIKESKNIRFEGNGYSEEWEKEAALRGLPNIKTTPKALDALINDKSEHLFAETGVFTVREAHARHEILLDAFYKKLQIEARVIGEMVMNVIIPAAIAYQSKLIENVKGLKDIGLDKATYASQLDIINRISEHVNFIKTNTEQMVNERKKANVIDDLRQRAIDYDEKVKSFFQPIRYHVDKLEQLVDDRQWPLPKFRELLFIK